MAITDRREIEFDQAAVLSVVAASMSAAGSFGLPGLVPTTVRFLPKTSELEFLYRNAATPLAVRLKAEAVGALLVSFCIRAKLPMPRRAIKGVRVGEHHVTLTFTTRLERPPSTGVESKLITREGVASLTWAVPDRSPESARAA